MTIAREVPGFAAIALLHCNELHIFWCQKIVIVLSKNIQKRNCDLSANSHSQQWYNNNITNH